MNDRATIPTPKLTLVSSDGRRPLEEHRVQAQPKTKDPADFRWGFVEEFLRSRELTPNTKKAYIRNLREFLNWTEKGLNDLSARDGDRYKEHLKTLPSRRGGTLSAATINQKLNSVQSFFKWLTAREYIDRNPMILIDKLHVEPKRSQDWSDAEIKALFDVLTEREQTIWRDQAMLWILLHGLRASEACALDIRDFDGKGLHVLKSKSKKSRRVPLLSKGVEAVENYLNWRRSEELTVDDDSPLLLSHSRNSYGERLGYWGMDRAVKAIAELAGVKNARTHRGRHTIATQMILKGIAPELARQITGHESPKSYEGYSKRGQEIEAESQFYEKLEPWL